MRGRACGLPWEFCPNTDEPGAFSEWKEWECLHLQEAAETKATLLKIQGGEYDHCSCAINSLPCPVKFELVFGDWSCIWWGNDNGLLCQKFFKKKKNVAWCSCYHDFYDFNFHFALNCFSVYCSWFIFNFCSVLLSAVWYDLVMALFCWKSLVSFLTHYDVP